MDDHPLDELIARSEALLGHALRARAHAETPAGDFHTPHPCELGPGEQPEPPADTHDLADQVAARIQQTQRRHDLATLKPNDRRALYLQGLGYRYREIMHITGASYTAINRRISEGRRALRNLDHDRDNDPPANPTPSELDAA